MVIIPYILDGEEKQFYMDNKLSMQIDKKVIPKVLKKDNDGVYIIDGEERAGKSVFAMQLAKKFDPTFCIERTCFSPTEFTKAVINATKGQAVVFDEAFTGLSSRGSLTEVNKLLVSLMMEMGQKNLFIIIVMPTFFLLDKYVALWRAQGLFHVYNRKGKRGYWLFFNKKNKKKLYLMGRKTYDYSFPRCHFRGRFLDRYTINEQQYREKKRDALNKKSRSTRVAHYMTQRDAMIGIMSKDFNLSQEEISNLLNKHKVEITQERISQILSNLNQNDEIASNGT